MWSLLYFLLPAKADGEGIVAQVWEMRNSWSWSSSWSATGYLWQMGLCLGLAVTVQVVSTDTMRHVEQIGMRDHRIA